MSKDDETPKPTDEAGRIDGLVRWLPGWYASRLHALPADVDLPQGRATARSVCGEFVFGKAQTEWAQRQVDRGVPHCKRCQMKLQPNAVLSDTATEREQ